MDHYVKLIWLITLSFLLLGVSGVWFYKEFNPEWKQHQRTEIQENEALKGKRLEIKQILLKGEGLWSNQESGPRVDRCMTCHIDEEKLVKLHPKELPIPYDVYGCTVCHGGNGRALESEPAHEHMYSDRDAMQEGRYSADEFIKMWKRLRVLNPEEEIRLRRESFFGPTGQYQLYVGNKECVECHKKTNPEHVNRWSATKFKTFERIEKEPDYKNGDASYKKQCYKCHTTGYREDKGIYAAKGVGCESCHGPGEVYAYLMQAVREESDVEQGQKLAKISFDFNICGDCHIPKRHEMRQKNKKNIKAGEN
ncbi:MAG TPA: hypothetical protein ENH85_08795 [Candidatus Scalindua sp.]|nr:hypothetical protein [Candidatus Scalindua sp.]